MSALYVSYYTEETPYEKIISQLRDSFENHGLDYKIYAKPDRGSWKKNTLYKAEVIQDALQESDKVVWVDADNFIENRPILFDQDIDCDFGILSRDYQGGWAVSTSVIFWQNTENALLLLKTWRKNMKNLNKLKYDYKITEPPYKMSQSGVANVSDQGALSSSYWELKTQGVDINLYQLPLSYCIKYDDAKRQEGKDHIVLHQAARILNDMKKLDTRKRHYDIDRERWNNSIDGLF